MFYSLVDGLNVGYAIAVDFIGNAYVTGQTGSPEFPTTEGAFFRCRDPETDESQPCYGTPTRARRERPAGPMRS